VNRGGKREGAGRKKGHGRWAGAETFNMRLPKSVLTWWEEFLQIVMERHLKAEKALLSGASKDKH
jgi:hypothetical protein